MPAVMKSSTRRRESASMWFRQLLAGQERQGTAKAAAAAWLGTIFALRASARVDGNKEWGKVGDDMIGVLEAAYLENMGKEGQQQIEYGRRLLRHNDPSQNIAIPQINVATIKVPVVKAPPKLKFEKPAIIDKLRAQAAKNLKGMTRMPAPKAAKAKKKGR